MRAVFPSIPPNEANYNVVQNNGSGAAQVIPHLHFHIIPRPSLDAAGAETNPHKPFMHQRYEQSPTWLTFGRGQRTELDDEEAEELIVEMRRVLTEEWEREYGGSEGEALIEERDESSSGGAPVQIDTSAVEGEEIVMKTRSREPDGKIESRPIRRGTGRL